MPAVGIYCAPVNEWACHVIVRTKRARGSLFALGQQTSSRLLPRLLLADRAAGSFARWWLLEKPFYRRKLQRLAVVFASDYDAELLSKRFALDSAL